MLILYYIFGCWLFCDYYFLGCWRTCSTYFQYSVSALPAYLPKQEKTYAYNWYVKETFVKQELNAGLYLHNKWHEVKYTGEAINTDTHFHALCSAKAFKSPSVGHLIPGLTG